MRLATRTNADEVFRDMDRFVGAITQVATPRALNKLRDQAQVAGLKEVARLYQIGPRTMEKYLTLSQASANDPEASVKAKQGRGFPLSEFKPITIKGKGVSVLIKGKRHLIPHAFMIKKFGLHVFARGGYGGKGGVKPTGKGYGRFQFGKGRLPIAEFFTFGPATAFGSDEVTTAMQDRVEEQAAKVFEQEIRFARG